MFGFKISPNTTVTTATTEASEEGLSPKDIIEEYKLDTLPWIVSPLKNCTDDELRLELRHESNTLELCFDLFFIANLATFTSNHSIIDLDTLVAYIGLFAIIWFTWFQITLHDVRFAVDSVYERVCKVIQFVVFVGFALVGSQFNPGGKEHNNTNFQILCILLFISRLLFAIQYGIALFFIRRKTNAFTWQLSLTITSLVLMGGAFYSMVPAFSASSGNGLGIYYVWYIILLIELVIIIGLSTFWRQLSFRHTHLMERMGLLTLIVIGEGAIGITKTVAKLMKEGLKVEETILVVCIILIMMLIWMFYFDNRPRHHYGTIRQQFWACLHFPLHLGIVGVLEGSQQIAISRHIFKQLDSFEAVIHDLCVEQNLDGTALANGLISSFSSKKIVEKIDSAQFNTVIQGIYNVTNITGVCSDANTTNLPSQFPFPQDFFQLMVDILGAIFQATGISLPSGVSASDLAGSTFTTVYAYYWASLCLMLLCFVAFLWITRHKEQRAMIFERFAIWSRVVSALLALSLAIAAASSSFLISYIRSPAILPTVAALLFLLACLDRIGRQINLYRWRRSEGSEQKGTELSPFTTMGQASRSGYARTPSVGSRENRDHS